MIVASRIPGISKRYIRKITKARGLKPPRKVQLAIDAALRSVLKEMAKDVNTTAEQIEKVMRARPEQIIYKFREIWRGRYDAEAAAISKRWIEVVVAHSRQEFRKSVSQAIGIDVAAVLDGDKVREAAEKAAHEASLLIKKIPEDYLDEVEKAAWAHYRQEPQPEGRTFLEQIQHIGSVSEKRATLIARDQTSKIHSAVNQARNEEAGVEAYIWRTAKDGRVVGNPSGLYPKVSNEDVHGNHYKREGKKFRWDSPPKDGHPGIAISCRCYAEPIIDMSNLQIAFG